jgi:hypothetical protein
MICQYCMYLMAVNRLNTGRIPASESGLELALNHGDADIPSKLLLMV